MVSTSTHPFPFYTILGQVQGIGLPRDSTHLLEDLGNLEEKVGLVELLGRGAPRHVDLEHVREEGLAQVQAQPAEEDDEHGQPLEVFDEGAHERVLARAVAHDGEGDVAEAGKDDD